MDKQQLCTINYRIEYREAKMRLDLVCHREIIDKFGFTVDLLLHALKYQLTETGVHAYLIVYHLKILQF